MKHWLPRPALVLSVMAFLLAAAPPLQQPPQVPREDARLPNGKLQRDEILKAEHEQSVKDAAQLVDLAQQLQQDIEKNDRYVLSLSTLKKADEIEKLIKKIRTRMRRN